MITVRYTDPARGFVVGIRTRNPVKAERTRQRMAAHLRAASAASLSEWRARPQVDVIYPPVHRAVRP